MIHDGDTFKVGQNCFAEFVGQNAAHREAFRIRTQLGYGICVEGEEIDELIRVLSLARSQNG